MQLLQKNTKYILGLLFIAGLAAGCGPHEGNGGPEGPETCDSSCDLTKNDCVVGVCTPKVKVCAPSCDLAKNDCVAGVCTPKKTCDSSCDLTKNDCVAGVCTPKGPNNNTCSLACNPPFICQKGDICKYPQNYTPNCTGGCESDRVCADGECVLQPNIGLPNGYTSNCPYSCANGTICHNGTCEQEKACNPECPMGTVCIEGTCVYDLNTCPQGCPDDQVCHNGGCMPKVQLICGSLPYICSSPNRCNKGQCIKVKQGDCYPPCGPDQKCISSVCEKIPKIDCSTCPAGKKCNPYKTGCIQADCGTCGAGTACKAGTCVNVNSSDCNYVITQDLSTLTVGSSITITGDLSQSAKGRPRSSSGQLRPSSKMHYLAYKFKIPDDGSHDVKLTFDITKKPSDNQIELSIIKINSTCTDSNNFEGDITPTLEDSTYTKLTHTFEPGEYILFITTIQSSGDVSVKVSTENTNRVRICNTTSTCQTSTELNACLWNGFSKVYKCPAGCDTVSGEGMCKGALCTNPIIINGNVTSTKTFKYTAAARSLENTNTKKYLINPKGDICKYTKNNGDNHQTTEVFKIEHLKRGTEVTVDPELKPRINDFHGNYYHYVYHTSCDPNSCVQSVESTQLNEGLAGRRTYTAKKDNETIYLTIVRQQTNIDKLPSSNTIQITPGN